MTQAVNAPTQILALDLSSSRGTLAVWQQGVITFQAEFHSERSHNARLFSPLESALAQMDTAAPGLLIVGTGPGSYTGVRISIAAMQGVALSRKWSLMGWPSLCAMADVEHYHVLGDARRGLYYHAEVRAGHLVQNPHLLTADQAQTRIEEAHQVASTPWFTADARLPLELANVQPRGVEAVRLAQIASGMDSAQLTGYSSRTTLQPLYLQEAFITLAKKPGKAVPAL
jgi:tRNA threonylcarbamoyladenosine biosynthesis protein TsaB